MVRDRWGGGGRLPLTPRSRPVSGKDAPTHPALNPQYWFSFFSDSRVSASSSARRRLCAAADGVGPGGSARKVERNSALPSLNAPVNGAYRRSLRTVPGGLFYSWWRMARRSITSPSAGGARLPHR